MRWACQKFYLFLYGVEFEIYTDHKPLVTVFSPAARAPSACTERWILYLQQFRFTIRHIPGKENSGDGLSRIPVGPVEAEDTLCMRHYACSIANEATTTALSTREVERASGVDRTLKLVRNALTSGDWTKMQGTMYKALKDELWVLGQLVMRDNHTMEANYDTSARRSSGHDTNKNQIESESLVATN